MESQPRQAQNKVSKILERHERQKVRCTGKILLIFLATVKLGRRSIEDKYELVLSEGGGQIFGLSLSGWNCRIGRKCAFYVGQLCPGRSRGRGRQQPIGSAHFWSYASLSPFLILCIISDHIAISDHLPYCRQQRASSFTSIKFLLSVNHYRSTCNSWMRKSQKFGFRFIKKTPMWQSTSPKTTQAETESIEGLMFWPVHQYCPLFHILYLLDNMYTSYWS